MVKGIFNMSSIADKLIAELRRNGRASVSELSAVLNVSRATIRSHMDRMASDGTIVGYTVVTDKEPELAAVRGIISIAMEGGEINRVVGRLRSFPGLSRIHTTQGVWDIITEFGVEDLATLDILIGRIRDMAGVVKSETSIFLRARH